MRCLVCGIVAALATTASLTAQVAPALCSSTTTPMSTTLAVPRFPPLGPEALVIATPAPVIKSLSQMELREIAGMPGQYRMAVTLNRGPNPINTGGNIVEGVYDANTRTYTYRRAMDPQTGTMRYTTERLDLSSREFALSITHDGLTCVFDDTSNTMIYWSRRAMDGDVFPDPKVVNFPGAGTKGATQYADVKIFLSDRDPITAQALPSPKLYLSAIEIIAGASVDIVVADFVVTGSGASAQASLANIRTLFSKSGEFGGADIHSQHPVGDGNGRVFGWVLNADLAGDGDDDTVWVPFINGSHGWHQVYDDPDMARMNNGTSLGDTGVLIMPHNQIPSMTQTLPGDPFRICTVSLNGDTWPAATGGRVQLRVMIERDNNVWATALWLGSASTPAPVFGTFGNMLGPVGGPRPPGMLGITPLLFLSSPFITAADPGGYTYAFRVPAVSGTIDLQALAWNTATNRVYLSNTAKMSSQ